MNARRIFAAAGFALLTAACGGGSGPTLADAGPQSDPPVVSPEVPPTDTTGFVPGDVP